MRSNLLTILAMLFFFSVQSQNTVVQTFNFNSETRDTVIAFPEGDHNQYEKIIMHYGMRCKDKLVSTQPAPNDRGCGEWDYSCNTYVVDSTRTDSLRSIDLDVVISAYDTSSGPFIYTTQPTFTYTQTVLKEVTRLGGDPDEVAVFSPNVALEPSFGNVTAAAMTVLVKKEELGNLQSGDITAINLELASGVSDLKEFVIDIQQVTGVVLEDEILEEDWTEVYKNNAAFPVNAGRLYFHTPFNYDGSSDLLIRFQYDQTLGTPASGVFLGSQTDYTSVKYKVRAYEEFVDFGSTGNLVLDEPLNELLDEVTISFWHNGAAELPRNSTVLEGVDSGGLRQMNIHLPWSNSEVYWDCGNDGSGYDRIHTLAINSSYREQWNHWTFTKNAISGQMKIFLNGEEWHSGTGMFKKIDVQGMRIGSNYQGNNRAFAQLSDLQIWDKALNATEIKNWMNQKLTSDHPDYDRLIMHYAMDDLASGQAVDLSPYARNAQVEGQVLSKPWHISEAVSSQSFSDIAPAITLDQGSYQVDVQEVAVLDSVLNLPRKVERYVLNGNTRELELTELLYEAGDQPIYDENGMIVGYVTVDPEGSIFPAEMISYNKSPMVYEIMSFVTPYGLFLDLRDGESWTFDVTHLGPILKGNKRIFMSQGGQWQEDMNIWFEFVEGQPPRDVLDVEQIWPCRQRTGHEAITTDRRFEPRLLTYDPEVKKYLTKTTITGHGQEGEFIPRTHYLDLGGFEQTWSVWTECADNPIYPQGGTWIYDRAGWCPGQASDVTERDLTDFMENIPADELIIDYGIRSVSGASNYLVSSQLVSYGPFNRSVDLGVEDIINPSGKIEHGRSNPTCNFPEIVLRNHGSESVSSAVIRYGIVGGQTFDFTYSNIILSEREKSVVLDQVPLPLITDNSMFFAEVLSVNGSPDDYAANDRMTSEMEVLDNYESDIVIEFKSNSQNLETSYRVYDGDRNIILSKSGGLILPNTTYRDTLTSLQGCYQLEVLDNDDDGLEFWANGDGAGFIRVRELGGATKIIEPDFGKLSNYGFTAGMISSIEEVSEQSGISLYPNPTNGRVYVNGLGEWSSLINFTLVDQMGRVVIAGKQVDKYHLADGEIEILNGLPAGIYYLTIKDERRNQTCSLIKQ